ncbi:MULTISPECIES: hypothetical protein [Fusobacterium]|nr:MULTISPECIES: hypothetical protein [Fusobacterium]
MFVVSMVSFSNKVIVSMGEDNVRDDAHPTTWVILNNQTKKYTLVKITETPHGGLFGYEVGDEVTDEIFKLPIIGFSNKYPEGYNTGIKAAVYLKYKGRKYKEIDYNTLMNVLNAIGYRQY